MLKTFAILGLVTANIAALAVIGYYRDLRIDAERRLANWKAAYETLKVSDPARLATRGVSEGRR